jgi:hypothetical protein
MMGADFQAGSSLGMPGAMARLGVERVEPQMTVPRPRLLPFRQVETPSRVGGYCNIAWSGGLDYNIARGW